jgi:hypothetical protein
MTEGKRFLGMDWRVALGFALTVSWITTGLLYLLRVVGWDAFVHLPTADIGSFLEGAFAPLAFLWLVIGHFMQQKEITANTRAIQIQEQSARRQEMHARRESYFKLLTLVQEQLGGIAGFHYFSVCGPTGTEEISGDEFTEQRALSASGDNAWFIRKMIGLAVRDMNNPEWLQEVFFSTEIRARHSNNYVNTFKKLLNAARAVDTDDMLVDALYSGSAHGLLYRIIMHTKGEGEVDPITGTPVQPFAINTANSSFVAGIK